MGFSVRQDKNVKSKDEGITLTDNTMSIDYVGAGVGATAVGNNTTVNIGGVAGTAVSEEAPSGTINDSNKVFTLAQTPIAGTLRVFLNGARQQSGGGDYTLSVATITFVTAPPTGSILLVDYNY